MAYSDRCEIDVLVGQVLTHIDVDDSSEEIMLTTAKGDVVKIFHEQDCCESVRIEDTEGNWHDLIGKVIVEAKHDAVKDGEPAPEFPDSWTRTTLTFRTDDATVINRWIGESNGYYSESVNIESIASTVR